MIGIYANCWLFETDSLFASNNFTKKLLNKEAYTNHMEPWGGKIIFFSVSIFHRQNLNSSVSNSLKVQSYHTINKIHYSSTPFLPQFWKLSPTLFCPLQLLGPAKQPMASSGSCKGQNKVGDNFQNCGGKVQYILSIVWNIIT